MSVGLLLLCIICTLLFILLMYCTVTFIGQLFNDHAPLVTPFTSTSKQHISHSIQATIMPISHQVLTSLPAWPAKQSLHTQLDVEVPSGSAPLHEGLYTVHRHVKARCAPITQSVVAGCASTWLTAVLVPAQMVLLMRVAVHNPVVSKSFVAGNMERSDVSEVEDMQMWRDVMVCLHAACCWTSS